MGPLTLPPGAPVYVDANILIYSIEHIQPYAQVLDAFWVDIHSRHHPVVTSELSQLEVLVGPLKSGNTQLEGLFRRALLFTPDLKLIPISLGTLERAAHLRAQTPALKTPDAIHAATALEGQCGMLLTNDPVFRRMTSMNVRVLSDLIP